MNGEISYTDFDRIVDTLMYFNDNFSLGFVTRLSRKGMNGERKFYEFESEYPSSSYIGTDIGRSIKRRMDFYYIIENKRQIESAFILRINDVYILDHIIKTNVLPWFFGPTRIYAEVDKRLAITGEFTPASYIKDLQKWLKFDPIVITYEDDTYKEGVRITINSVDEFIDLTIDRFIEFASLLNFNNMYIQSMAQCNYVKIAPYTENNLVIGGGLGSGGSRGGDKLAEQKYGIANKKPRRVVKEVTFLDKAKFEDS